MRYYTAYMGLNGIASCHMAEKELSIIVEILRFHVKPHVVLDVI